MKINAKEKIEESIYNRLSNYKILKEEEITDEKNEISGIKIAKIKEIKYENGMTCCNSLFEYEQSSEGNIFLYNQIIITDYNGFFINIKTETEMQSFSQVLSGNNDSELQKSVTVEKTSIDFGGGIIATFTRCLLSNNELVAEKYSQISLPNNFTKSTKDLLTLCENGEKEIVTIYYDGQAVAAKFSDDTKICDSIDLLQTAKDITFSVGCELYKLTNLIGEIFTDYEIKSKQKSSNFCRKRFPDNN